MTKIRERAFAWLGIIVFTVSALALTATVIIEQVTSPSPAASTPTAPKCSDTTPQTALPAPAVYIPSGPVTKLQVVDLSVGSGPAAKSGDCLVVKYYGTLASNGKVFDENFTQPTGFAFVLGVGQVIPGWDEGLVGLKVGGTRRLVIPPSLAYGSSANNGIPANSTLVFVVKLLKIQS